MTKRAAKGRPTYCRPPVTGAILANVKAGLSPLKAALAAGVGKVAFYDWKKKAEEGKEPYKSFVESLDAAIAEAELDLLKKHRQLAETTSVIDLDDGTKAFCASDTEMREKVLWKHIQRMSDVKGPSVQVETTAPDGITTKTTIGVQVFLPQEEGTT